MRQNRRRLEPKTPMRLILLLLSAFVASAALAQEYADYHGRWQGQFLFQIANDSGGPPGGFAVHPGTLDIGSDGNVRGQVPTAGCALTGSGVDFVSSANASIDVDISGCRDTRFNGRFSGKLINNTSQKYASLRLSLPSPSGAGSAQVSAILRR
jgi:hypothetical protein